MEKTLIAMSGGVDSSVAALLIKREYGECAGVTLRLYDGEELPAERGCCSLNDAEDAKSVAYNLGIPHYVFNFTECFSEKVIGRFVEEYRRGRTPNPCIDCNRYIKFEELLRRAETLGYSRVATGHYARIEFDGHSGRYLLKKAADSSKDQSYVLYSLTQYQLEHTLFPLGGMTKSEVRGLAEQNGFVTAKKQDSQDICFVPDGKYADFIERRTGERFPCGSFIDSEGNVLGTHRGIIRYTPGQRKGLGLSMGEPVYVLSVSPEDNTVTVGRESRLYTKTLTAKDLNLISVPEISSPMRVKAKVRYRQAEQWATAVQTDSGTLKLEFDEPQRAVTPGQAVVLYDGDTVVGGGTIE